MGSVSDQRGYGNMVWEGRSPPPRTRNFEAKPDMKEAYIIQETAGLQRNYESANSASQIWPDSASKSQQHGGSGVTHRFLPFL